jgi:alpha-L-fucosidase
MAVKRLLLVTITLCVELFSVCTAEDVLPQYPTSVLPEVPDANGGDISANPDSLGEYIPSACNLAMRKWFQEARLGMFIHWGIYANLGRGEWVLHNDRILLSDYRQLAPRFNPVYFNATEWVLIAKDAGMRYITITAKHHDGFCLWHTRQTQWNIVDAGGYGKDIIKALASACREHGMKLALYYSPLDWSHHDYYPRGFTGTTTGRPEQGNWEAYLDYMHRQIEELVREYGSDLLAIWLDGWWDLASEERWRSHETYEMIHSLNPDVLIGNNHHRTPFWGEDIQIFEKDAPGENTKGYAHASLEVEDSLPLETCDTLHHNGAWGYTFDHTPRPIDEVMMDEFVHACRCFAPHVAWA